MISAPHPAMHRLYLRVSVSLVVGMVRAWIQQEGKYLWRLESSGVHLRLQTLEVFENVEAAVRTTNKSRCTSNAGGKICNSSFQNFMFEAWFMAIYATRASSKLVDCDWGGMDGEVSYPMPNLSPEILLNVSQTLVGAWIQCDKRI
jgi:hypothetical protein